MTVGSRTGCADSLQRIDQAMSANIYFQMSSLTTQQKIGQLFFIGIPGPEIDERIHDLLDEIQPGGVCLFSRNVRERAQTRNLLDGLRETLDDPFLSVDQEGGLVDRLRRLVTPMP